MIGSLNAFVQDENSNVTNLKNITLPDQKKGECSKDAGISKLKESASEKVQKTIADLPYATPSLPQATKKRYRQTKIYPEAQAAQPTTKANVSSSFTKLSLAERVRLQTKEKTILYKLKQGIFNHPAKRSCR